MCSSLRDCGFDARRGGGSRSCSSENAVANLAEGSARFTVVGWANSVLATAPDVEVTPAAGSAGMAFVVLPAVALAGWLAATLRYRRADID
ncbi:hypothetical protein BH20ACT13_BH20ACT13_13310 [soil metagenome]